MKHLTRGCIVLEHLRTFGYRALVPVLPNAAEVFHVVAANIRRRIPLFYEPHPPIKVGDAIPDADRIWPPYDECWIETQDNSGQLIGYMVIAGKSDREGGKRVVTITAWTLVDNSPKPAAMASVRYVLNDDGTLAKTNALQGMYDDMQTVDGIDNGMRQGLLVTPCVIILQRMNMRNIGFYVERDPEEDSPSIGRERRRHLVSQRYHVLVIRNWADIRADRKVVPYKGVMPLHWARGHIARYGPKYDRKLLFGKYEGEFWIQPHAKGRAENGTVDKDYTFADPNAPKRPSRRHRHHKTAEREPAQVPPVSVAFPATPSEARDSATAFNPVNVDRPVPQQQEANQ